MIKKFLFFIILVVFLQSSVVAQSPKLSPTTTLEKPTPTKPIDKSAKIINEKIATMVAQMQKKNKKVIAGEIVKKDKDSFDLKTSKGELFKVTFDDVVTKAFSVSSGAKKTIELDEFKKGDLVIVAGPLIENTINANTIYIDQEFVVGSGKVAEVDRKEFFVKVISPDKTEYTIDIESFTKQELLDTTSLHLSTYGFSKLKEGDTVHFTGKKAVDKKSNRFSAAKIIIIPQESFIKK